MSAGVGRMIHTLLSIAFCAALESALAAMLLRGTLLRRLANMNAHCNTASNIAAGTTYFSKALAHMRRAKERRVQCFGLRVHGHTGCKRLHGHK